MAALLMNRIDFIVADFMYDFMGLFYIVFSFFKFLDYKNFPDSFAIYDLIKFLGVLSNMSEPELDFDSKKKSVTISDGGTRKINYRGADLDYIVKPEKDIDMPECEINFTLKESVFDWINQQATVLQLNDFYFKGYIGRLDLRYQFSNELNLRFISEYNDFSEKFFFQPLVSWTPNPDTIFYIGGNQNAIQEFPDYNSPHYVVNKSQIFLKFQYLFGL